MSNHALSFGRDLKIIIKYFHMYSTVLLESCDGSAFAVEFEPCGGKNFEVYDCPLV